MDNFQLFKWESEKVHPVSGLKYTVRLADFPLTGENGETEATMFSFSYVRAPRRAGRPVAFAYNGGPGSASVWLHMGLLGPKLVRFSGYPDVERPAHFELTDNAEFLLDQCDLVLIDPSGTGWAKPAEETAAKATLRHCRRRQGLCALDRGMAQGKRPRRRSGVFDRRELWHDTQPRSGGRT